MGAGYRFINKADKDNSAEVFIYEDVGAGWFGGVTAKDFANDLRSAGKVKTIDVRIASYGGDVAEALREARQQLLEHVRAGREVGVQHDARVVVHVDSTAASIASVIAMAGAEIIIAEAGSIMIHNAWMIAAGNEDELRAHADQLGATSQQLAEIYAARTKNGLPKIKDWMRAETWFRGKEAVDAGFADTVAANVQAAHASTMWHSVMHGRIAQQMHLQRAGGRSGAQPHPANDDVRQQLAQQAERQRARLAARTTPIPN